MISRPLVGGGPMRCLAILLSLFPLVLGAQTTGNDVNGGVVQILPGVGISLSPTNGIGNVTVNTIDTGTISLITSPNSTLSITNASGPTTNIDIPTSYLASPPTIGGTTPGIVNATTIVANGSAGTTSIASGVLRFNYNAGVDAVGIGTGTTTGTVNIGGGSNAITINAAASLTVSNLTTGTNADFVCLSSSGVLLIQASACTISSLRFKEDYQPVKFSTAIAEVNSLEILSYRMKPAGNPDPNATLRQTGLIAENVAQVAPECAIYEDDLKTPKSYRQECIIALLVKSVQEQQKQITYLRRHAR